MTSTRARLSSLGIASIPMRSTLIALAIIVIALAITVTTAVAASTRADYVAQVDPICQAAQKPTLKTYDQLFKAGFESGHRSDKKRAKTFLDRALGRFYIQVGNIYARVTGQISTIAAAPGDEATVALWLSERGQAAALAVQAGRAEKHLKRKRAHRLLNQSLSASGRAVRSVSTYEFRYCSLDLGDVDF
jgi:hypothetical protein